MDHSSEARNWTAVRNVGLWSLMLLFSVWLLGCSPIVACQEGVNCETAVLVERTTQEPEVLFAMPEPITEASTSGDPIYLVVDMYRVATEDCGDDCSEGGQIEQSVFAVDSDFVQQEDGTNVASLDFYLSDGDEGLVVQYSSDPALRNVTNLLSSCAVTGSAIGDVPGTISSGGGPSGPEECEVANPEADCFQTARVVVGQDVYLCQ